MNTLNILKRAKESDIILHYIFYERSKADAEKKVVRFKS